METGIKELTARNIAIAAIEHAIFCDADILTENWDSADEYFMEEFGCTVSDAEEALNCKFDIRNKWPGITIQDILTLHPSLLTSEKEVYVISSDSSSFYLEVYINSDFGCEYCLYDEDYSDIDGGVIDDEFTEEGENASAQLIFELLEDMDVRGTNISRLPEEAEDEEDILSFEEKVQKRWEEKVMEVKRKI